MLLGAELKRKSIHLASLVIPVGFYLSPAAWTPNWKRALLASVIFSLAIEVFRINHPRARHAFRRINYYVRHRLARHLRRRSQRRYRHPADQTLYRHLEAAGLIRL